MNELKITVQNLENSVRLDQYVSKACPDISRSRIKNGTKSILLNNKESKLSAKVKNNDEIFILWEDPVPKEMEAQDIPLDILYEDENVCVVNKKQGMVTHPGCGNWNGTLVNALMYHWKIANFDFNENDGENKKNIRKGIVHRLDKDTSGTIITAKNIETEIYLQKQFAKRRVKKEYILICQGVPKQKKGNVKVNMIRDPKNRKRFTTTQESDKGKFSHTVYKCLCSYGPYSLIRCRLKTGRTHQIRVHMKYLGCPILGDPIYGARDKNFETATLMLHSSTLSIRLPKENEFTVFKSPTPIRFKKVMKKLKEQYQKIKY